ncbi:MAG: hypothetical protein Q8P63_03200 [Candidatus Nealsonbacteria bacterium]|nr:hypothetical protein [Candidatus Nealsonbacteria bacterium]
METIDKKHLFWDVEKLDSQKDAKFIIERILALGDEEDFKWATDFYGKNKLKEIVRESRNLDKKSFNFWSQFFNIKKEKCTLKQSPSLRLLFWKR